MGAGSPEKHLPEQTHNTKLQPPVCPSHQRTGTGDWRRLTRSFSADRWGYDRWWGIDSMCTLSFISLSRICTSCCMEGRWPDSSLDHTGTSSTEHGRKAPLHWEHQKTGRAAVDMELRSSGKLSWYRSMLRKTSESTMLPTSGYAQPQPNQEGRVFNASI